MVKPIAGSSPQRVPLTNVEESRVSTQKEQTSSAMLAQSPQSNVPPAESRYDAKAQAARRAEHSIAGTVRASQLQAELLKTAQSKSASSIVSSVTGESRQNTSMSIPRVGWEISVGHGDEAPLPTPYPNIASTESNPTTLQLPLTEVDQTNKKTD